MSMEFVRALENLQVEASCFICSDYLKDPVTISCGHNFCFSCITKFWKDLDISPCPICRFYSPERKVRSNTQLGNLSKIAKRLQVRRSKRKKWRDKIVCKKHNLPLNFFCQRDLEVLCSKCSFSPGHRKHHIWPVSVAASYHRRRLEFCTASWKKKVKQAEKVIIMQTRKSLELKKNVEFRREEIKSEFEHLKFYLQNEQETALQQLEEEEVNILTKQCEHLTQLSDHITTLKYLLKEMKSKSVKSALEVLMDVKRIYSTYNNLKSPEPFSLQLKEYGYHFLPQYSGLNIIIEAFQEDVILDTETAHHHLTISENRKTVQYGRTKQKLTHSPRRFYHIPAVLGSKGYNSGRHYWEVEVDDKLRWIIGVCKETVLKRRKRPNHPFSVQDGLWGIGKWDIDDYVALGFKKINLLPSVIPRKIGIFLDCDLGEVSFYNLNDKSLLYTFNIRLVDAIWPYFYTGNDPKPLKICMGEAGRWC